MLDGEDHIKFCLDRALLLVDWENVKHDFVQSYPQSNFRDKNWFQTLWADDIWYDQLVSALLAQEWLSEQNLIERAISFVNRDWYSPSS